MEDSYSIKTETTLASNKKKIKILVEGYKNFLPTYPYSKITVSSFFLNEELGVPQSHALVPRDYVHTEIYFQLHYCKEFPKEIDKLISAPITFNVVEEERTVDIEIKLPEEKPLDEEEDIEVNYEDDPDEIALKDAIKMKDAFHGTTTKRGDLMSAKEAKKKKKEKKQKVKDLIKKKKTIKSDGTVVTEPKPSGPIQVGTASIDLLPLFLGNREICELIPVKKSQFFSLEDCRSIRNTPYLQIRILCDECLVEIENSNIVNLTVESLYNLPSIMAENMFYQIAVHIPNSEDDQEPLLFQKFKYCTQKHFVSEKCWFTNLDINLPASKYKVEDSINDIKNRAKADLQSVVGKEVPRVEYNTIKRTFMKENVVEVFEKRLKKFRNVLFEIYVTPQKEKKAEATSGVSTKTKSKSDKSKPKEEDKLYIHLMAFADVSTLLLPGIQKCRIACPLKNFHEQEISKRVGEYNSVFLPKKPVVAEEANAKKEKSSKKSDKSGGKSKKDKSSKSSKSKKSKASKKSGKSDKMDITDKLPTKPPSVVIEPCKSIYNEAGQPTFLIVEFELSNPLVPARTVEDLSERFYELIPKYPKLVKHVTSCEFVDSYFQETIRQLLNSINEQYRAYSEELEESECYCEQEEQALLSYLHREGVYKTYVATMQNAMSLFIKEKYPELANYYKDSVEYQTCVSEIYANLINATNKVVNLALLCEQEEQPTEFPADDTDQKLFYAKESCELGAFELAKKYHLQRLEFCGSNPDFWFDFAVYHAEIDKIDKAMECLKEALTLNTVHINSLIMFGALLMVRKKYSEAETFFLLVTVHEPRLVEGWGVLYILYNETENLEGQELCMEMINKYIIEPDSYSNYFFDTDDLAWAAKIIPRTPFFKVAILMLKMRVISIANLAISLEIFDHEDHCQYLMAISFYYGTKYKEALFYISKANKMLGFDYAIVGLLGHSLTKLRQYAKAREAYDAIIDTENRPDDIHLIYINCAIACDRLDVGQSARKILLLACKYCPTPYTWLGAGLLYFHQKDYLSAEACFTQANVLDNVLPEIWAYLTIVNVELDRKAEAQLCYRQVIRNGLHDSDLLKQVNLKIHRNRRKSKITFVESDVCNQKYTDC